MKRCAFCHGDGYTVQGEECRECQEQTQWILTAKGISATTEQYWREKIAREIESAVIEVAGDSAATLQQAADIARNGIDSRTSMLR